MSSNRISVSIPEEVITQSIEGLIAIKALLQPYLQTLTVERKARPAKNERQIVKFCFKGERLLHNQQRVLPFVYER